MNNKKLFFLSVYLSVIISVLNVLAQNNIKGSLNKTTTSDTYTRFSINNISTFIYNNGNADIMPTGNSGLVYPRTSGATAIFISGLLWGGKVDGEFRVGGSAYRTGLIPGKIVSQGIAEEAESSALRVYRVRTDYNSSNFNQELLDGEGTKDQIYTQYDKDWNEWPASKGAPFTDIDNNGIYDPSIDIPGVPDANETLWFVANDLNETQTKFLYGSKPIGLEVQVTVWGYVSSALDHMLFKKYKLINKSGKDVTDMYFGIWSDPDLGSAGDDFVGCDTLLNLCYAYNESDQDNLYQTHGNLNPPAIGFAIIQGPRVSASSLDSAYFDGRILHGMKNLPMTAFVYFAGGDPYIGDPPQGNSYAAGQWYNFMSGKYFGGNNIYNLSSGLLTTFMLSGDPVTKQGWLDGVQLPSGDRRMMSSTGPFNLAAADTQEIVIAEIAAGAEPGVDRLKAIEILRNYAFYALQRHILNRPQEPSVISVALDKKIVLNWGDNINNVKATENNNILDLYKFQGYNIYQYTSDVIKNAKAVRVATFDLVDSVTTIFDNAIDINSGVSYPHILQYGFNTGLQRYFILNKDYLTNLPLNNGSKYYYAVTAYNYSGPDFSPKVIESKPQTLTVIPHSPDPGVRYGAEVGTVINSIHSQGNSKGNVEPIVIDPTQLLGHSYKVTFKIVNADTLWDLIDNTTQTIKLQSQKNQNGDEDYLLVDGLLVKVINDKDFPNTPMDIFTFTTPGNTYNDETAKTDIQNVNVFPNPFYISSFKDVNEERYVTFSHLPQRATIRIYNLAGWLIKTFVKDSPGQFYKFKLLTNDNANLAAGVYVAFIEMPGLGKIKILKFAVIQ